ncbi:hypothetical protein RUM44_006630 [Polyplax serrata]|uniref:Uncharacterized protein n=1 Tax=Polyplax serrata TaxID=468196 RepID=A0ABR1AIN8_POLSC
MGLIHEEMLHVAVKTTKKEKEKEKSKSGVRFSPVERVEENSVRVNKKTQCGAPSIDPGKKFLPVCSSGAKHAPWEWYRARASSPICGGETKVENPPWRSPSILHPHSKMQERAYGNWVHHHPFKIPFCRTELWQLQQENLVQDLRVFTHDVLTKKAATIYGSQSSVVGHPCAEDRCEIQTEWRVHVGLVRTLKIN